MRAARQWFGATTGGLPTSFWYLWTGTLVNRAGAFVIIFLAVYLTQVRDFSPTYTGLVIGLNGAGGAVGVLIGGALADRWGRRPTLLAAQVSTAALLVALGLSREPVAIAVIAGLVGLTANAVRPAFSAMMVDVVPAGDRLRAFNLNYWAINLGYAVAAALAGLLAETSYLLLFIGDACTTLVTAAIVLAKVPESRPAAAAVRAPGAGPGGFATLLRDRVYLAFIGLTFVTALVFMQNMSTLPIAMQDDGLSPTTYGLVIGLNGVLIVVGQLFIPRLSRGFARSDVLTVGAIVLAAGFGLTSVAHTAWLYAVTVLIWTVGEMLQAPVNSTLIAELSPTALRGRYQGGFSLAYSAAAFAAPVIGGYVLEHAGSTALWLGCLAVGLAGAGGQWAAGPARERRAAVLADVTGPVEQAVPEPSGEPVPAAAAPPAAS